MKPVAGLSLLALVFLSPAAQALDRTFDTQTGRMKAERVAGPLEHPWGLGFLPDGAILVTERPGRIRLVAPDGATSEPLKGTPQVFAQGQGGLLDLALDPDFANNRLVYMSYAEPGEGGASTAVARGRLEDNEIKDLKIIFRQQPKVDGPNHFGSRLVFGRDGTLFVALGERFKFAPAQDLASHLGKIVRINPDGTIPADNPFVATAGALPEIWSYGHRNIQGAALHPETGALWVAEHGPRGGDEVNVAQPGQNYGWPLVSWGRHYSGEPIPNPPTRPDLTDAIYQWTPVIAASGAAFYTGDLLPDWQGDLLVGGLVSQGLVRLTLDGEKVVAEERIPLAAPIRQVRQGPDGAVYVLTDKRDGEILRLSPANDPRG
jgi:glucose/arabinose dehydrogenase